MGRKQQNTIETNKPFSLRVIYAGGGMYDIIFSYKTTVFQPISYEEVVLPIPCKG